MKSIIQPKIKECFLCREEADRIGYYGELPHTGLHRHHFIFGCFGALRKKAEHYGLWGYVCAKRHHEWGPEAPHVNAEVAKHLRQVAQKAFEEKYGHETWMKEFEINYLEDEEDGSSETQSDHREPDTSGFIPLDTAVSDDL